MSLDDFGNVSDFALKGHKDRPAMPGALNDWLSGSHSNIFRVNAPSESRPLNTTGSNDYIDFAVIDSPYGGNNRNSRNGQGFGTGAEVVQNAHTNTSVSDRPGGPAATAADAVNSSTIASGSSEAGPTVADVAPASAVREVKPVVADDAPSSYESPSKAENQCTHECDTASGDSKVSDSSASDSDSYTYSAEDKFDEILLGLERALRAAGRGSYGIVAQWLREIQADLLELMQALAPKKNSERTIIGESNGKSSYESAPSHGGRDIASEDPRADQLSRAEDDKYISDATHISDATKPATSKPDRSKPVTATIDQLLSQNDRSQNPVRPGENTAHFGWADGRSGAGIHKPATPDPRYNYLMAWNMVYPEQGKTANPDASVEMQNFRTYVHTKDGQWLEVLNQNNSGIGGGLSDADFADPYAVYDSPITNRQDGVASFKAPPPGFNFQPWINDRGAFDNQNIDGIYISGLVRSDRSDSNLVIDQGADWYARQSGTAVGTENSDGVGTSNWLRLTDSWQPLLYSTLSAEDLRRNPPPGITA